MTNLFFLLRELLKFLLVFVIPNLHSFGSLLLPPIFNGVWKKKIEINEMTGVILLSEDEIIILRLVRKLFQMLDSSLFLTKIKRIKTIGIGASLSLIGSSFILMTYLLFKKLRTGPNNLVFNIALSDFFSSVSFLLSLLLPFQTRGYFGPTTLCVAQGFLAVLTDWASISWVSFHSKQ